MRNFILLFVSFVFLSSINGQVLLRGGAGADTDNITSSSSGVVTVNMTTGNAFGDDCNNFSPNCAGVPPAFTLKPVTGAAASCVRSCCNNFESSSSESFCDDGSHSIWYKVETDDRAITMQVDLSNNSFEPYISVLFDDCDNFTTLEGFECRTDVSFEFPVTVNETYYIVVESQDEAEVDENFDFCVSTSFETSTCYGVETTVSRPENTHLDSNGPYCPGETVRFCYEITFEVGAPASVPPDGNGCQWIQGIIPCLGPGWDLEASMLEAQAPMANGGLIPWFWLDEGKVTYNFDNEVYELFRHSITKKLVLVHHPDLANNNHPLSGGDFLPGGWWATSSGQSVYKCGNNLKDPNVSYGMYSHPRCGTIQHVDFCIDLRVKSMEELSKCESAGHDCNDLSLDLFVFADGETGCFPSLSCGASTPGRFDGKIDDRAPESVNVHDTETCSGRPLNVPIFLQSGGKSDIKIEYSSDNPKNVSGGSSFVIQRGNGYLQQTLNVAEDVCKPVDVIYIVSVIEPNVSCPGEKDTLKVTVYPLPKLKRENLPTEGICYNDLADGTNYEINLEAECGKPGKKGYKFSWKDDKSGKSGKDKKIVIDKSFGSGTHEFTVTVTDDLGCNSIEKFDVEIYSEIKFELKDATICWGEEVSFEPENIGTGDYKYNWSWKNNKLRLSDKGKNKKYKISEKDFRKGKVKPGTFELCLEVSQNNKNVTCSHDTCVDVKFSPMFAAIIKPDLPTLCDSRDTVLIKVIRAKNEYYFADNSKFRVDWSSGSDSGSQHEREHIKQGKGFEVTIVDKSSGCDTILYYDIEVAQEPDLAIEGDLQICEGESTTLTVTGDVGDFKNYKWNDENGSTTQSITVSPTDNTEYTVTVTTLGGCEYRKGFEVSIISATDIPNMADVTYCVGHSQKAIAPDGYDTYEWYINEISGEPVSKNQIVEVDSEDNYILVVTKNGCPAKDTITGIPSSNLNPNLSEDTVLCSYVNSTIVYVTEEYSTIKWYDGIDANGQLLNSNISKDTIELGVGTYYLYVADDGGCDGGKVFNITKLSPVEPNIYPTEDTIVMCYGKDTILYSRPTDDYEEYGWYEENTEGSSFENNDTVHISKEGKYYLRVKDSLGCYGFDSIYVDIVDELIPQLPESVKICEGDSVDLDVGAGFTGYTWYIDNEWQSQYNDKHTIKTGKAGTYAVAVFDEWGCSVYDTTIVGVIPKLEPNILGARDLCDEETIPLSSNKKFDVYKWSTISDNSIISTDSLFDFEMPAGKDSVNVILTVTFSEGNAVCEGADTVVIKRYHSPKLKLTNDTIKTCGKGSSGSAIKVLNFSQYFNEYDNKGGSWKDLGNSGIKVTNNDWTSVDFTEVPIDSTYKFEFKTNSAHVPCVDIKDTLYVQVELCECDGWEISPIQNICTNENTSTINLNDSISIQPAPAGKWSVTDGDAAALSGSVFDPLKGQPGAYELTYTLDDKGNYCEKSRSITFEVQNQPKLDIHDDVKEVCGKDHTIGSTILNFRDFFNTSDGEANYTQSAWVDFDVSGVGHNSDWTEVNFENVPADSTIYRFVFTTNYAKLPCTDVSDTLYVKVVVCDCIPWAIKEIEDVCNDVNAASFDLDNYIEPQPKPDGSWSVVTGDASVLIGSTFNPANADAGTYVLKYTLTAKGDYCDESHEVNVVVQNTVSAGEPLPALTCEGTDVTYVLDSLLRNEHEGGVWTEISEVHSTGNAFDAKGGTFRTAGQAAGTYVFKYSLDAVSPCEDDSSEVEIIIEPIPVADPGEDIEVCFLEGESVTLKAKQQASAYSWTLKGSDLVLSTDRSFDVKESGVYQLRVETEAGCFDIEEVEVTIRPDILVEITGELLLHDGDSTTLQSVVQGRNIEDIKLYNWTLDGEEITGQHEAELLVFDKGEYCVEVEDVYGCFGNACVTVNTVFTKEIDIPNIFSPNGDNNNDKFFIRDGKNVKHINMFKIFDRWGELVYSSGDFPFKDRFDHFWDGEFRSKRAIQGVYIYVIDLTWSDGQTEMVAGDITLIR